MQIAETPAASNSLTVLITLIALPKPVSQSAMTGIDVASTMARAPSSVSLIVRMLASGTARTADRPKPLAHTASKPASSTSFAERASCAPQATAVSRRARSARSDREPIAWRYLRLDGVARLQAAIGRGCETAPEATGPPAAPNSEPAGRRAALKRPARSTDTRAGERMVREDSADGARASHDPAPSPAGRATRASGDEGDRYAAIKAAFDFAAIGMAVVGADGRFLRVNRALCEMVGRDEDELLGTDFQHITHPDDLEADLAELRRALDRK